jgi:hypothetical protein
MWSDGIVAPKGILALMRPKGIVVPQVILARMSEVLLLVRPFLQQNYPKQLLHNNVFR